MKKRYFRVMMTNSVSVPIEKGFINNELNRNHLMYNAQKIAEDAEALNSHKMEYSFSYIEEDTDDWTKRICIPISPRTKQEGVSLKEAEDNKQKIKL